MLRAGRSGPPRFYPEAL